MSRAVVALGANLGDRERTLRSAIATLEATERIDVRAVSPLLDTVALTVDGLDADRPGYLNGIALLDTELSAAELLDVLLAVELEHGRDRGPDAERWGDRTLDLDLVDYDGEVLETARLSLPHPRAHERDFVLVPWLAVDPDAELPLRGRVADLLEDLR